MTILNRRAVARGLVCCMLAGCSVDRYAGIDLRPGRAPGDVQALARRAAGGDKLAQLELGIRFEEARGVTADLTRAKQLYSSAANEDSVLAYSPPTGRSSYGMVYRLEGSGAALPEAKRRLQALRATRTSAPADNILRKH